MYARVATVQVQPGKMEEFLRRYRAEQVPALQAARGFREARVLTDAHTGTVMGVTVWETEADAKAGPNRGAQGGALMDLITQPVVLTYYELSVQV